MFGMQYASVSFCCKTVNCSLAFRHVSDKSLSILEERQHIIISHITLSLESSDPRFLLYSVFVCKGRRWHEGYFCNSAKVHLIDDYQNSRWWKVNIYYQLIFFCIFFASKYSLLSSMRYCSVTAMHVLSTLQFLREF